MTFFSLVFFFCGHVLSQRIALRIPGACKIKYQLHIYYLLLCFYIHVMTKKLIIHQIERALSFVLNIIFIVFFKYFFFQHQNIISNYKLNVNFFRLFQTSSPLIADAPCKKNLRKKCYFCQATIIKWDPILLLTQTIGLSKLLPTLGRTRIKNRTNSNVGIYGELEKVKSLLYSGLFKRSGKRHAFSNLKALTSFNSFVRLYSQTVLPKIKKDESQNIAKAIERNEFLHRSGIMDRIANKTQSNASLVLLEKYCYYSALLEQSFWKKVIVTVFCFIISNLKS